MMENLLLRILETFTETTVPAVLLVTSGNSTCVSESPCLLGIISVRCLRARVLRTEFHAQPRTLVEYRQAI